MTKDTEAKVDYAYRRAMSALSPERRLIMSTDMYGAARAMVYAGIRSSTSRTLTPTEFRERFFLRMYGRDYGPAATKKILAGLSETKSDNIAKPDREKREGE